MRRDLRKKNDGLDQDGSEQSRAIQPVAKITVTTFFWNVEQSIGGLRKNFSKIAF